MPVSVLSDNPIKQKSEVLQEAKFRRPSFMLEKAVEMVYCVYVHKFSYANGA